MPDETPRASETTAAQPDDAPADGEELTLEGLSRAYAELLGRSAPSAGSPDEPRRQQPEDEADSGDDSTRSATDEAAFPQISPTLASDEDSDEAADVTPRGIVEAMLFVGDPANRPVTNRQIAALIRGVSPTEVDQIIAELNAEYRQQNAPYEIISDGPGYRMALCDDLLPLRNKFYGRIREARLSQAAIDVLALVAYNQPVTRPEVDRLRGKPSGSLLTQMVRRRLLRIERVAEEPRVPRYHTTERFLRLFHLDTLEDLPRSQEGDA